MDGYLHHEQKKQDLQVSKKGKLGHVKKGKVEASLRSKGWIDKELSHVHICISMQVCVVICYLRRALLCV